MRGAAACRRVVCVLSSLSLPRVGDTSPIPPAHYAILHIVYSACRPARAQHVFDFILAVRF